MCCARPPAHAAAFRSAGDLTDSAGVEALIEQVRNAVPAVDILVLNASVQRYVTLDEFDEAEFLREFQANVGAAFRLVQAFAPAMCERKHGRIIIVGSVNQFRPSPRADRLFGDQGRAGQPDRQRRKKLCAARGNGEQPRAGESS